MNSPFPYLLSGPLAIFPLDSTRSPVFERKGTNTHNAPSHRNQKDNPTTFATATPQSPPRSASVKRSEQSPSSNHPSRSSHQTLGEVARIQVQDNNNHNFQAHHDPRRRVQRQLFEHPSKPPCSQVHHIHHIHHAPRARDKHRERQTLKKANKRTDRTNLLAPHLCHHASRFPLP
jgi:Ulp1 family protease